MQILYGYIFFLPVRLPKDYLSPYLLTYIHGVAGQLWEPKISFIFVLTHTCSTQAAPPFITIGYVDLFVTCCAGPQVLAFFFGLSNARWLF
jgi:hypothetical protein